MSKADLLLAEIIEKLRERGEVRAVWLAGSRGRGANDEFSDIDIWVALQDDSMPAVVEEPLSFVNSIVPTVMHIHAPSIAPDGGAFLGCWVPVDGEFVQVDWYLAPATAAARAPDTTMVLGDVSLLELSNTSPLPWEPAIEKAGQNLALALQSVSSMVKYSRRGRLWAAANSARHGDDRLRAARGLLADGIEPGFGESGETFLSEPPPSTVREVQDIALSLLDEIGLLSTQSGVDFESAISAMRAVVINWRETGWKPTEEYYRTLPRRYMGAGVLITDADNNVLILETTYKNVHEIPGGVCEAGESPRDTACREVREELGIDLQPGRLLVMDSKMNPAPKGDSVMFVYDGGIIEDRASLQPDLREIREAKFVPMDSLEQYCTPHMALRLRTAVTAREHGKLIEIANGKVID